MIKLQKEAGIHKSLCLVMLANREIAMGLFFIFKPFSNR